jgi:hypothetical protein
MSLDVAAIPWSVSNGDKWEAREMVATDGREKRASLDNLARVLGTRSFRMHANSATPNLELVRIASR